MSTQTWSLMEAKADVNVMISSHISQPLVVQSCIQMQIKSLHSPDALYFLGASQGRFFSLRAPEMGEDENAHGKQNNAVWRLALTWAHLPTERPPKMRGEVCVGQTEKQGRPFPSCDNLITNELAEHLLLWHMKVSHHRTQTSHIRERSRRSMWCSGCGMFVMVILPFIRRRQGLTQTCERFYSFSPCISWESWY